jgi:copper chaperone NosL
MRKQSLIHTLPLAFVILLMSACSTEPEPIRFGKDKCEFCDMMIADVNYGAELVTSKGRVQKFDAVECLVNYKKENDGTYAHELAVAFDDPKKLHPIDSLSFIISKKYKSPMGKNIAAFLEPEDSKTPDKVRSWEEVRTHVLGE